MKYKLGDTCIRTHRQFSMVPMLVSISPTPPSCSTGITNTWKGDTDAVGSRCGYSKTILIPNDISLKWVMQGPRFPPPPPHPQKKFTSVPPKQKYYIDL